VSQGIHGYFAHLFHPDLGNESKEGRLSLEPTKLRFVAEDFSFEIPADQVDVSWDAAINRINFRDTQNPGVSIVTYDELVLRNPSLPQVQDLRAEIEAKRSRKEFAWRIKITLGVIAAGILVTACFSLFSGVLVRAVAARVPPEMEREFGLEVLGEIDADVSGNAYSNEVAQLTELARPLLSVIPRMGNDVKFFIVDDPDPNAFALPGGFVVVNTGLLELVERPEELQGVLAHELAHVTERHIFRQMAAAAGPMLIVGVLFHSKSGLVNLLALGSGFMIVQGFSKEYETEADEVGWDYLVKANIDPRGMTSVFQKFRHLHGDFELPEALSSHPLLDKRIQRLEKRWSELKQKTGFLTQTNAIPLHQATTVRR